ncbi:MAG: ribosome-associated translation inhibitor RaiA [Atopobiaceae bacterium]|jgi:putative sigma-54 modulation protein|nr:ribosome-associated translation inhibitor RaiA [Atopobiaceae bacterium]MCH4120049.1 ribosome-associated translation inhibitor RaiA [Atopobiaceae bacterium]MCI1389729.1 ribosome-associated translation inhibitor RaiA [Atopobiaceae bacterium]MCI1432733.1 ribosome-associated translation inhibitor RaiA [Atopobiaceae bacterium]MCI1470930.1 ribosome-associated translation inhibitor RaiA [Atopobiaceae bacterium]
MVDIKVSGRKIAVTDSLRDYVDEKIGNALKVFDIKPMTCDVVLRVNKNPSNPDRKYVEVTVFVRDNVVRVVTSDADMYAAIDEAADKVTRQLRKYKTRVIDRAQRPKERAQAKAAKAPQEKVSDLGELIEGEDDDQLVREKYVELHPMTEEEALVQTDLLGHDFYVFENATTGLVNVVYRRKNGGYGIIKPKIEEADEQ